MCWRGTDADIEKHLDAVERVKGSRLAHIVICSHVAGVICSREKSRESCVDQGILRAIVEYLIQHLERVCDGHPGHDHREGSVWRCEIGAAWCWLDGRRSGDASDCREEASQRIQPVLWVGHCNLVSINGSRSKAMEVGRGFRFRTR